MRTLLLAVLLFAAATQGTAEARDLKLATWNLEWLTARADGDPALPEDVHPKIAADIAVLGRYLDQF